MHPDHVLLQRISTAAALATHRTEEFDDHMLRLYMPEGVSFLLVAVTALCALPNQLVQRTPDMPHLAKNLYINICTECWLAFGQTRS